MEIAGLVVCLDDGPPQPPTHCRGGDAGCRTSGGLLECGARRSPLPMDHVPVRNALPWLVRHGVAAQCIARPLGTDNGVGEAIRSYAADTAADLIVSGAHGHGMQREAIFGGPTRTLLRSTTVPVLFSR